METCGFTLMRMNKIGAKKAFDLKLPVDHEKVKLALSANMFQKISRLPEVVMETVVVTQEEAEKKRSAEKKKNKERGKVRPPKGFWEPCNTVAATS